MRIGIKERNTKGKRIVEILHARFKNNQQKLTKSTPMVEMYDSV